MKKIHLLIPLLLLGLLTVGCTKKPAAPPAAQPARISATSAYEKYFGPAPTSDKGSCFAFVIYFPSARDTGKVVPFPFFTFDEASIRKVAVERLLGGMDIGSYKGEFLLPFPAGTHVVALGESQGTVTLTLSKEFGRVIGDKGAAPTAQAIALTLGQFKGVTGVRVLVEGNAAPLDIRPDERTILPPGPPRLLSVTAVKEKGDKAVEEVNAFFDRPVDVGELHMSGQNGRTFAGGTYHSVFDMAAVLKPQDGSKFTAGQPIRVRWRVTDKLGRQAEGDGTWSLEIREHEHE